MPRPLARLLKRLRSLRGHRYDYRANPDDLSAAAAVVRMVGRDKDVLELGAGPGSITKLLHGPNRVTALEVDEESIHTLSGRCDRVVEADLSAADWPSLFGASERFDAIVLADVLEHLYDPWATLERAMGLLRADGSVVVSLPHVGHASVLACILGERFEYQPSGLLDRTHIRFFGVHDVQSLFDDANLHIVDAAFVLQAPDKTELSAAWRRLPEETRELLGRQKYANVYQIVVRASRPVPGRVGLELGELPLRAV